MTIYRKGAVGALLHAYQKAITELQQTINDVTNDELVTIADNETNDERCKSIQTILTHVVAAGYSHSNYIRQLAGEQTDYRKDLIFFTKDDYCDELNNVFSFITDTFKNIEDDKLEELDNNKKVITKWSQVYDIEQMAEHAIVHFIKHTRQVENFKTLLRSQSNP